VLRGKQLPRGSTKRKFYSQWLCWWYSHISQWVFTRFSQGLMPWREKMVWVKCLTVNLLKIEAMVFTKKYIPEPIEILRLGGREVAFTNSVKYLGVLLEPKIIWKQHITERKEKFFSSMWACRRAVCKSRGISPKTVLPPEIFYVSVVSSPTVSRLEAKNLLRRLQSSYLRAAVRSMKTKPTPTPTLVKRRWK